MGKAGRMKLAVMVLALAASPAAIAQSGADARTRYDVLYLMGGEGLKGTLQGCSAEACILEEIIHPRAGIVMIGLAVTPADAPPPIADPLADAVNRRDTAAWEPGRLIAIDEATVVTEEGSYDRTDVAWVYLAPRLGGAAPPPAGPTAAGEAGALWTGRIDARYSAEEGGAVTTVTITADPVRLREVRFPLLMGRPEGPLEIGTFTRLDTEGTVITQTVAFTGTCSGGGQGTVTLGRPEESAASAIWLKTAPVDATPLLGADIPEGEEVYAVGLAALLGDMSSPSHRSGIDCGTGYSEDDVNFSPIGFGNHPGMSAAGPGFDPQTRTLDGDRMVGSYHAAVAGADWTVAWSLCRNGASCPPPP
jgi:hypothetical protein